LNPKPPAEERQIPSPPREIKTMANDWTEIAINGKPADVFEPESRPRFGLLFLHDTDGETLRDRPVFTDLCNELRLAVVCPQGKESWWLDRMCPEFAASTSAENHVVKGVLPYFGERWAIPARGVAIMGVGMGGQGALRLAFKHRGLFPVVAGIAPALDFHELYGQGTPLDDMYESKEQCRQDTALLHVPPHDYPPHIYFCIDPADRRWFRGNDRLHEKLNALGIEHRFDFAVQGGGHSWEYYNRMAEPALRFLFEGLEAESRRLL
jgi:S-formylglutathione hydrolase